MIKALTCVECTHPLLGTACVNLQCKLCGISQLAAAKEVNDPTNIKSISQVDSRDLQFVHTFEFPSKKFRFIGVSRFEPQPNNLMIAFNRPVTDRELVTIHELLKDFTEEQNL